MLLMYTTGISTLKPSSSLVLMDMPTYAPTLVSHIPVLYTWDKSGTLN